MHTVFDVGIDCSSVEHAVQTVSLGKIPKKTVPAVRQVANKSGPVGMTFKDE